MRFSETQTGDLRHRGPPLWLPAISFALLFNAVLYFVRGLNGAPSYPQPWELPAVIVDFFQARPSAAMICGALQFGAAVPLGIYSAVAASRLRFLGVQAAGTNIAFFGGVATSMNMMVASSILWAMSFPEIAENVALTEALYRLEFALGGPGFSVPFGVLIAGIAVTAGLARLFPKWLFISGLALGIVGGLSWLDMLVPQALPLIPLTRFPGFLWLILAGFSLPDVRRRAGVA